MAPESGFLDFCHYRNIKNKNEETKVLIHCKGGCHAISTSSSSPWGGFDAASNSLALRRGKGPGNDDGGNRAFRKLVQKAHAAERAAAIAYRGIAAASVIAATSTDAPIGPDEWRHRAWLRRRIMPAAVFSPTDFRVIFSFGGLSPWSAFIGPFLDLFAGRLKRDNGTNTMPWRRVSQRDWCVSTTKDRYPMLKYGSSRASNVNEISGCS